MPFSIDKLRHHFKNHYLDIVVELSNHFENQVKYPNNNSDPLGHCAYVIFPLCLDFFEALGQLIKGRCSNPNETVKFFKEGYDFVFAELYKDQSIDPPYPILDLQTIEPLVKIARHGMAHSLIPNGSVSINGTHNFALSIENGNLVVCNAIVLPRLLARRFDEFVEMISQPAHADKMQKVKDLWDEFEQKCTATGPLTTANPAQPQNPKN